MADFRPNSVRTPHAPASPARPRYAPPPRSPRLLGVLCAFVQILVGFARLEGVLSRETDEDLYKDDGFRRMRATVAG